MLEPSLQFQAAVRSALIADPAFAALVAPANVRSGGGRPGTAPTVILGDAQTELLGHAAGGQYLARVHLTLHVWCVEDGNDTARAVGFALLSCLRKRPSTGPDCALDDYTPPTVSWVRDPSPEAAYAHGIVELDGVLRWKV